MSIYKMQEILESIGLYSKETSIYLANLRIGTNPVSVIAREAGIQRSTAYSIIEKLKKRGFIMELKKGNLITYTAAEPRRILNYLKFQQTELGAKINDLSDSLYYFDKLKTAYHSQPVVNLLEGENSIIYVFENMLATANQIKMILSKSDISDKLKKYFLSFTFHRVSKKIPIKIIAQESVLDEIPELINKKFCEMRFLEKDFAQNSILCIYQGKTATILLKNGFAILTENIAVAENSSALFDLVWNASTKKDSRFCSSTPSRPAMAGDTGAINKTSRRGGTP